MRFLVQHHFLSFIYLFSVDPPTGQYCWEAKKNAVSCTYSPNSFSGNLLWKARVTSEAMDYQLRETLQSQHWCQKLSVKKKKITISVSSTKQICKEQIKEKKTFKYWNCKIFFFLIYYCGCRRVYWICHFVFLWEKCHKGSSVICCHVC